MFVKICGINKKEDVLMVASFKPDYMGFVLNCPNSPRSLSADMAKELVLDLKIPFVFLFVNEKEDVIINIGKKLSPFAVQLHGDETAAMVKSLKQKIPNIQIWKAIHLPVGENEKSFSSYLQTLEEYQSAGCDLFILDSSTKNAYGGTGITCDWDLAAKIVAQCNTPILLAGGLTPINVKSAIAKVKPFGVDVSSGVERVKAQKDKIFVEKFIQESRS